MKTPFPIIIFGMMVGIFVGALWYNPSYNQPFVFSLRTVLSIFLSTCFGVAFIMWLEMES
jgi:hypothetical protein